MLGRVCRTDEAGQIPEAGGTVAGGLSLPSFELFFLHFQCWWTLLPFVQSPKLELCETKQKRLGTEKCRAEEMVDRIQSCGA